MVRRRRFLCENDGDTSKRREVSRFLQKLNHEEQEENEKKQQQQAASAAIATDADTGQVGEDDNMISSGAGGGAGGSSTTGIGVHPRSGTSLNDIYPVYRRSVGAKNSNNDNEETSCSYDDCAASWSRIPSLLLVEGDYVALQIGDIVPAECVSVDEPRRSLRIGDTLSPALAGSRSANHLT